MGSVGVNMAGGDRGRCFAAPRVDRAVGFRGRVEAASDATAAATVAGSCIGVAVGLEVAVAEGDAGPGIKPADT